MLEVPSAGEQSFEGRVAIGDVGGGRVDDARRAWIVLQKVDEAEFTKRGVFGGADGHVRRAEDVVVTAIGRDGLSPRPLLGCPVGRHDMESINLLLSMPASALCCERTTSTPSDRSAK